MYLWIWAQCAEGCVHVLQSICVSVFISQVFPGLAVCRNRFLGHTHGAVSDYVVRLETLDPSTPQLRETLNSYRSLQNQLEKMVS